MRREERRCGRPSSLKGVKANWNHRESKPRKNLVGDGESNTSETGRRLMQEVLNLERERAARYCEPGSKHDMKYEHKMGQPQRKSCDSGEEPSRVEVVVEQS